MENHGKKRGRREAMKDREKRKRKWERLKNIGEREVIDMKRKKGKEHDRRR